MDTLTTEELKDLWLRQEDFVLVNVLDEPQFEATHIPESVNLPASLSDFSEHVLQLTGSKQRRVVVYGAGEGCQAALDACDDLQRDGFNVAVYSGGAAAWKASGEPLAV
ncbi:rhodanese-like domain-containing protein [Roseiconus nitratireducens]|uniref:rhodanese-like domain-containing protein n=1 Tax=Roseiconus nitratireducens TaxID=2605748 RepID=UPI001375FE7B|nr:rhodanese-like domain-containing protein [Roseiconus nitratireducens]